MPWLFHDHSWLRLVMPQFVPWPFCARIGYAVIVPWLFCAKIGYAAIVPWPFLAQIGYAANHPMTILGTDWLCRNCSMTILGTDWLYCNHFMTILSRNWLCRKSSHDHFAPRMVMLPSKNNQSWPILVMRHFDKEDSANWAIFRKEINFIQLSSYLFSSIGKTLLHSFCLNAEGATPYDAAPSVVLSEEEGFFYDSKHFLSRKRLYWLPKTIKIQICTICVQMVP